MTFSIFIHLLVNFIISVFNSWVVEHEFFIFIFSRSAEIICSNPIMTRESQQSFSFRLKCWVLWNEEDHLPWVYLTHSSILNSALMLVSVSNDARLNEVMSFKTYRWYILLRNMVLCNGGTRKSTDGSWEWTASFSEKLECSWILSVLCNLYAIFML